MSDEAITRLHSTQTRRMPKQLQQLRVLYDEAVGIYGRSAFAQIFEAMLQNKSRPQITRVISLGLGSLLPSKDQQRRIKQLVLLMAIASHLDLSSKGQSPLTLYAQDPTFTATDEAFLQSLGIHILRTPSLSDLGEAGRMINGETLIYSPFLTITTYNLLLSPHPSMQFPDLPMLIGDDFNALKLKWDKGTGERRDVDGLIKIARDENYHRRAVNGDGFWEESDRPFPMAVYWRQSRMSRPVQKGRQRRLKSNESNALQQEHQLVATGA